jgi:hypothetical protein
MGAEQARRLAGSLALGFDSRQDPPFLPPLLERGWAMLAFDT